ncbi:carboxymuconolactone decarboxylase family protein [Shimia sediminis]|uniref:carboxymuconolactone decarboxylase family protein n=1 Tax=Shimia sediminis TaxID=2497945 RepID=UPI000F8DCA20|nr:carboxymuconolactone decarboxylase family protein [Shimia sediminis]
MKVDLHTPETAPEAARDMLTSSQEKMGGFLPNLYRQMAETPVVLETYFTLQSLFGKTRFTPAEQQLILLTTSVENECRYCVPAHSSGARMAKLDKQAIEAIRTGAEADDSKLQALRAFTEEALKTRGQVSQAALDRFVAAGYEESQAMELLIGLSMKTLSNYFARLVDTPLEDIMARMAWDGKTGS